MPRKNIQRNLAYDSERRLYYAVFRREGKRYTRTYRTYQAALEALGGSQLRSSKLPAHSCTVERWLNWWLEEVVARDRAASTLYGYRNIARCHLVPAFGQVPLTALSPIQIQTYLYAKMDEGLSPNTVLKHYVLLTTALGAAVRLEVLERSPMDRVTAPKKQDTRYTFYTPDRLRQLFTAVEGTRMELPVKLAAYLGLRRSEICGLRWEHVDFAQGTLAIREIRTEVGGRVVLKDPKTRTSVRRLSFGGATELVELLHKVKAQRPGAGPKDFVVLREDGKAPMPDQLTRDMLAVVRQYRLPPISLHGLRHSFASVANSQGIPMFDISRTLGHSSIAVTSNIYTHLFDDTETQALAAVARAIGGVEAG